MPLSAAFGTTTQPVRLQCKFEAWNAWEWEDVMRMCVNQVIHHMSHHIMKLAKLGPTKSAIQSLDVQAHQLDCRMRPWQHEKKSERVEGRNFSVSILGDWHGTNAHEHESLGAQFINHLLYISLYKVLGPELSLCIAASNTRTCSCWKVFTPHPAKRRRCADLGLQLCRSWGVQCVSSGPAPTFCA